MNVASFDVTLFELNMLSVYWVEVIRTSTIWSLILAIWVSVIRGMMDVVEMAVLDWALCNGTKIMVEMVVLGIQHARKQMF
jgi:hypothetical protein